MTNLRKFYKEHSLSIILLGFVIAGMIASWNTGVAGYRPQDYSYFQYWISQVIFSLVGNLTMMALFVILTKHFIEKGSAESKE